MTEHKRCRIVYTVEYVSCTPKSLTIATLQGAGRPQLHMWQLLESQRDYCHMCDRPGSRWDVAASRAVLVSHFSRSAHYRPCRL